MIELTSELTCPHCGHRAVEEMPTDACQFFYDCEGCGCLLRPKPGDCCVFCSYGVGALSAGPAGQILPLRMPRRAPRR
ncbi:GDCCVxC domain-containing (seleno)protein [Caenispirillum salinarum]|nr:GDCCVxC domain-containing (seleno)protein [Caenispirillum salinarum]